MDLIDEMQAYVDAYKSAEGTLDELGEKATDVRSRHDELYAQRESFEQQIREHERSVAALRGQREDLKLEHAEASFSNDQKELERIARERTNLEQRINKHHKDIRAVRESLDGLSTEDLQMEAAKIYVEAGKTVDGLPFVQGDLYSATTKAKSELSRRADAIKDNLPHHSEAQRWQVDAEYRARQEGKEQARAAETARIRAKMAENERNARKVTLVK